MAIFSMLNLFIIVVYIVVRIEQLTYMFSIGTTHITLKSCSLQFITTR